MQPFFVHPAATTPTSLFSPRTLASTQLAVGPDVQPVSQCQLASMRWMLENSRIDWRQRASLRQALDSLATVEAASRFQEHLMQAIEQADIREKDELRRRIALIIKHNPDFFSDTWYGREEVSCCWHNVTSAQTTWQRLHEDYTRLRQAMEVWGKTKHLVEKALVDADRLQTQLRREARDPTLNLEEEKDLVCRLAVELLAAAQHPASDYPVQQAMRQLYEVVQDSDEPKQLVTTISRAFEALLNY
jgi:hypothetical protein